MAASAPPGGVSAPAALPFSQQASPPPSLAATASSPGETCPPCSRSSGSTPFLPQCGTPGPWLIATLLLACAAAAFLLVHKREHAAWCDRNSARKPSSCSDAAPRHYYVTYWAAALVLLWIPLAQALKYTSAPGAAEALNIGSFTIAAIAGLVFAVRILVMGIPGDAPWTATALDLITHIGLPLLAISLFLSRCVGNPGGRGFAIGGGITAAIAAIWLTLALVYWSRTGKWVYGSHANPNTPAGIVGIVGTVLLAIGSAVGLAFLKMRLTQA